MVHRFHNQVLDKMSPERRARNLTVMKALARTGSRKRNKENQDPLNSNMTLPLRLKHSTPLKNEQVTDLYVMDHESDPEIISNGSESNSNNSERSTAPSELAFAKMYDLIHDRSGMDDRNEEKLEMEVIVTEDDIDRERFSAVENNETAWKSLEVVDGIAEYEFFRSLEQSKMYLSASNLLEEIEADLPSRYSLAKPLNHTFHSLTSYRTVSRLARLDKNLTCLDDMEKEGMEDIQKSTSKTLDCLEMEAMVQKVKIKQAEKALILSRTKKSMEVENLESEKTLLLASLRFNAAVQEIEKLKLLGDAYCQDNSGQITISGVEFVVNDSTNNSGDIFICTATEKENVQFSLQHTKVTADGKLYFDEPMKFQNLNKDFIVFIELFKRQSKEVKAPRKTCIMKKLKELTGVNMNHKATTNSSVSNHRFVCVACAQLSLKHISERESENCELRFNETPYDPILGETIMLRLKTSFNVTTKKTGFLNVFKHTWHRRWYSQTDLFLNSWLYPEDWENGKPPIDSVYLPYCKEMVKAADLEVCIRPNSFIVLSGFDKEEETIFAADSNKDMIKWISHLNLIISNIQLWKPNV